MKKLPRGAYPVFFLTLVLIGVLIYGFYYENYLKPIDCASNPISACPARCAICSLCADCELSCALIDDCKKSGFYDATFEQIRTHGSLPDPGDVIRQMYEPALRQYPAYDHLALEECDQTMCVKIYLKEDSADLKSKMPPVIDGMKVVYIIMENIGGEVPAGENSAVDQKCGMENCHGMEIVCGANVPDVCTEIYMLGDGCRQFAECGIFDGKCQPMLYGQFDRCKDCVKKCESDFSQDSPKMFECESICREISGQAF